MKQGLSKHQTTGKWLDRNHTRFEFMEKKKCLNVRFQSVKNGKKEDLNNNKVSGSRPNCCSLKLHVSDTTIGKQTVHSLWLEFEKMLDIS